MLELFAFIGIIFLTNYITVHFLNPKFGNNTVLIAILQIAIVAFFIWSAREVNVDWGSTASSDW